MKYQVFILTHDRVMFEDTLKHIELFHKAKAKLSGITSEDVINKSVSDNWSVFEMYQAIDSSGIPKPFITYSLSHVKKALYYFREQVDYNACGNNLRAALEDFFIEFIPSHFRQEQTMLGGLLVKAREYFDYTGFSTVILDKLERHIKRSLNPTSHYNPKANYYKKELEDIFDIYFTLKQLKNRPLIEVNEKVKFSICTKQGNTYTYFIILMDDVIFYNKNDKTSNFLIDTDKRMYQLIGCTTNSVETKLLDHSTNNLSLKELYDDTWIFRSIVHQHSAAYYRSNSGA